MSHGIPPGWSDEAVDLMKTWWLDGKSAQEIANTLRAQRKGDFSRCAVLGKLNRLGLSGTQSTVRKPASAPKPRELRKVNPAPAARSPAPRLRTLANIEAAIAVVQAPVKVGPVWPIPTTAKRTLDLVARDCKFPVGPDTSFDQLHCGARTDEGEVYCPGCRLVAFQPRVEGRKAKGYERMFLRTAGL